MAVLTWDQTGEKKYENGVSKGVLYKKDGTSGKWLGESWNGLTGVTESPDGAEPNDKYADNIKYGTLRGAENFGGTITAFTYPDGFASCDGSAEVTSGAIIGQQPRETFRFCYRTEQGNDEQGVNYGYKLHLVYNSTCSPSERAYETINEDPDMIEFSWEFKSTPVAVTGYKPTSVITIDSTKFNTTELQAKLTALENKLYGTENTAAEMPDPDDVLDLID